MQKYILSFILLLSVFAVSAQEKVYHINGERLSLQTEVEGNLTLLWNIIDQEYRYFIEKNGEYAELLNTRQNGEYQEEYKETLAEFTKDADVETGNLKLVLYNLRDFVNQYNSAVDPSYTYEENKTNLLLNLGVFGGISNNVYTHNPDNAIVPVLGIEVEFIEPNIAPRHSGFLQLKHTAAKSDYDYQSVQLSLNYRFKFINKNNIKFHLDAELLNFYYADETIDLVDENNVVTGSKKQDGFSLKSPLSLGIGTDIRILSNGYLTLSYNDFISLALDSNKHFPVDFTVGYKMNL